jgi:hypothetical protein
MPCPFLERLPTDLGVPAANVVDVDAVTRAIEPCEQWCEAGASVVRRSLVDVERAPGHPGEHRGHFLGGRLIGGDLDALACKPVGLFEGKDGEVDDVTDRNLLKLGRGAYERPNPAGSQGGKVPRIEQVP